MTLGLLLAVCLFGLACEDSVNPFIEEDRFYTLYGFLDTATDTQFVRVIPLRLDLNPVTDSSFNGVVTSTALEATRPVVWRDSLVHFDDGTVGHVFYSPMNVFPGWTYHVEIRRKDGATTGASTTIPVAQDVVVGKPGLVGSRLFQRVTWQNVDFPPFRVEVWYRFANFPPSLPFKQVVITYPGEKIGDQSDEGWRVSVDLNEDRNEVLRQLGTALPMLGMGMRITISDEKWRPPNGVFDPELLVQPGVFSNVEGGFGFLGSVNQFTVEWLLPEKTMADLGYPRPAKR